MRRTSLTHPLQIAVLPAGPGFGGIGITFCPDKYDRQAMTGYWDRDLDLDLDVIRDWGAVAVATLLEDREFALLRVERLGDEVRRRAMLLVSPTDIRCVDARSAVRGALEGRWS